MRRHFQPKNSFPPFTFGFKKGLGTGAKKDSNFFSVQRYVCACGNWGMNLSRCIMFCHWGTWWAILWVATCCFLPPLPFAYNWCRNAYALKTLCFALLVFHCTQRNLRGHLLHPFEGQHPCGDHANFAMSFNFSLTAGAPIASIFINASCYYITPCDSLYYLSWPLKLQPTSFISMHLRFVNARLFNFYNY